MYINQNNNEEAIEILRNLNEYRDAKKLLEKEIEDKDAKKLLEMEIEYKANYNNEKVIIDEALDIFNTNKFSEPDFMAGF